MTTQHTPGPLTVHKSQKWGGYDITSIGGRVGYAHGKANADLWAASPELLAALEKRGCEIVARFTYDPNLPQGLPQTDACNSEDGEPCQTCAAIAKVRKDR